MNKYKWMVTDLYHGFVYKKGTTLKSAEKENHSEKIEVLKEDEVEEEISRERLNELIEKYRHVKRKPTIIGKDPYDPFLVGSEDNWMSTGDNLTDD